MCFVIEREIYLYNNFEFTLFPYGMMKDKNVYMIFPTKIYIYIKREKFIYINKFNHLDITSYIRIKQFCERNRKICEF
jgi:hypothetical protein